MRRDREHEFGLADIRREAGTASHSERIAGPGRWPKRLDIANDPRHVQERTRNGCQAIRAR
jgi:hypothetical protein